MLKAQISCLWSPRRVEACSIALMVSEWSEIMLSQLAMLLSMMKFVWWREALGRLRIRWCAWLGCMVADCRVSRETAGA